jgi:hypothetical protein
LRHHNPDCFGCLELITSSNLPDSITGRLADFSHFDKAANVSACPRYAGVIAYEGSADNPEAAKHPGTNRCRRWVKNGSRGLAARCPLRPQQRTSSLRPAHCIRMSDIEAVLFVVIVALVVALAMLVAG